MPRLHLYTKLAYGIGQLGEGFKNSSFETFLFFYYNQVLGVSGTWTGIAIFLALCVDAIADPLVGSLSDGWRSRFGRRHPFMYAAALPMGVCFALLFLPPDGLSERALAAWLRWCRAAPPAPRSRSGSSKPAVSSCSGARWVSA